MTIASILSHLKDFCHGRVLGLIMLVAFTGMLFTGCETTRVIKPNGEVHETTRFAPGAVVVGAVAGGLVAGRQGAIGGAAAGLVLGSGGVQVRPSAVYNTDYVEPAQQPATQTVRVDGRLYQLSFGDYRFCMKVHTNPARCFVENGVPR